MLRLGNIRRGILCVLASGFFYVTERREWRFELQLEHWIGRETGVLRSCLKCPLNHLGCLIPKILELSWGCHGLQLMGDLSRCGLVSFSCASHDWLVIRHCHSREALEHCGPEPNDQDFYPAESVLKSIRNRRANRFFLNDLWLILHVLKCQANMLLLYLHNELVRTISMRYPRMHSVTSLPRSIEMIILDLMKFEVFGIGLISWRGFLQSRTHIYIGTDSTTPSRDFRFEALTYS